MDFTYEATGGLNTIGCADCVFEKYVYYAFGIGSIVFSKPKAIRGVYARVCIKNVLWPEDEPDYRFPPLYVDTFNACWNEEDLISYTDAVALVTAYNVALGLAHEDFIANC